MADAEAEIAAKKPDIVIAESTFGKQSGLDLLQRQRENNPDSKKSLFILLTGNSSQSAVARAAEEDVDAFILKPFTPEVLRSTLIKAALLKAHPPEYIKRIEIGKAKIVEKDFDGALADFTAALALDPSPALARYYIGHIQFLKAALDQAKGEFEQGLALNKIHYKCLVGLYDLLMDLKMHKEAYEVVKKVSQYFPANPKRLSEILRLAIVTQSYADVERYYAIFCNIDTRNETLVNYICAALIVCGKHYVKTGNRTRALELFQKAVATSAGRTKFLREIVQTLVDGKLTNEALQTLKRYPADTQSSAEYRVLELQVLNLTKDAQTVLNYGRELISQNVDSDRLYEVMLTRAIETDNARLAESLLGGCATKYPALKTQFEAEVEALIKKSQKPEAAKA
jgi:tetratricopeptide (TPR) repeat protein